MIDPPPLGEVADAKRLTVGACRCLAPTDPPSAAHLPQQGGFSQQKAATRLGEAAF